MVNPLPGKPGAARDSPQQQAAYSQAFQDVAAHVEADDAFSRVKAAVEGHLGLLQKQAQVRVRNWVKKLSEETANVTWKKNRNAYARLLLGQLRRGTLAEPFNCQPPDGPLPTLPKHLAYAFKPPRGSSSPAGGAAPTFAAPATAHPPAAPDGASPHYPHRQQEVQQPPLTASEQLDEYLGRASYRRTQQAEEQAEAAVASPTAAEEARRDGRGVAAAAELPRLPSTRMQLRGAEGRRVDRHQLEDAGWQPSKLELQAELGASRERQVELEWRLQQLEGALGQPRGAAPLGAQQLNAPLGSLLDALEDSYVSPQRQRAGRREVDELLERYESRRRHRRSQSPPRTARSAPPAAPPSHDAEMLEQLGSFQRQTDSIRRQLGGSGAASHTTAAAPAAWGAAPEATPLRQHPTGLRGGGHTPAGLRGGGHGTRQPLLALFDGLPQSPAELASMRWQSGRPGEHTGQDAGSAARPGSAQQQAAEPPPPPTARPHTAGPGVGGRGAASEQQRPSRSLVGLETRHTKKSAAAAAERAGTPATAALLRLKSTRQALPAAAAAPAEGLQAGSTSQQGGSPAPADQRQQQRAEAVHEPQPLRCEGSVEQQQEQLGADEATSGGAAAVRAHEAPVVLPPELPPDSNAALVAEVRQLRSRLLASLQKHAPQAAPSSAAPGASRGRFSGGAGSSPWWEQALHSGGRGDAWRLPAVPPSASPAASAALRPFRLDTSPGTVAASSGKHRLSSFGSSGALSGLGGEASGALLPAWRGAATPSSLGSGVGSPARLSSGDAGAGLSLAASLSLEAFEQQTAQLRRQLARL